MDMTLRDQLKALALAYSKATDLSVGRISTLVFGDGGKLGAVLADRADITTIRFEKSMRWFSANWPDGHEWPHGVDRPAPVIPSQTASPSLAEAEQ